MVCREDICFNRWKPSSRSKFARRQLATLPRIYFEVDDDRPDESQAQENSTVVFSSGALSIPTALNYNVLKYLTGNDLIRISQVSTAAQHDVWECKALLFDAIRVQIDHVIGVMFPNNPKGRRQVNNHGFKKKNRVEVVRGGGRTNGYVVGVTSKHILYVCYDNIFDDRPLCQRVKSVSGVVLVRPYIGDIVERVKNWDYGRSGDSL